jgi:hypothetical protein
MKTSKLQKGQALILIALAFIGLASFIGLAVDGGILFIQIGHLRRAVDSAALGAANQFREGNTIADITTAAEQMLALNNLTPITVGVFICDINNPTAAHHDPSLCPPAGEPPRKFVRVEATMEVNFFFMPIVDFDSINIYSEAVSETASVDLVLSIDRSPSMTYDAACDDGDDDDLDLFTTDPDDCGAAQVGAEPDDFYRDPDHCNDLDPVTPGIQGGCHPFEEVRTAALDLAGRMYFPYDRMAIITFDVTSGKILELNAGDDLGTVEAAINGLTVYKSPGCPGWPDPSGCTSTNIADGLREAGNQFPAHLRTEAVWIVILLTDGGANAATDPSSGDPICPGSNNVPTWVEPFCRDEDFEIGDGAYGFDAEDAAVYEGYGVGCPADGHPNCPISGGKGAIIFTIGLGDTVTANSACDSYYGGSCEPDQGEALLRFIAGIGDDGDPLTPAADDPCDGASVGQSCGNYYYSPTGSGLLEVFQSIAQRIFTRITH